MLTELLRKGARITGGRELRGVQPGLTSARVFAQASSVQSGAQRWGIAGRRVKQHMQAHGEINVLNDTA